jgi:hypothetical protein
LGGKKVMEFIKLEQFKGLEENIQKVFLYWWKPRRYDLYIDSADLSQVECLDYIKEDEEGILYHSMRDNMSFSEDMIPLFVETQLRRFIEEKTGGIVKVVQWNPSIDNERYGYTIYVLAKDKYEVQCTFGYELLGTDLLQAYWKVALKIAEDEVVKL